MSEETDEFDGIPISSQLKVKPPPQPRIEFNLNQALQALADDNEELSRKLVAEEERLRRLRSDIVNASRRNFILERELGEIDEKIKLLIKNRISIQEVMMHSNAAVPAVAEEGVDSHGSPLRNRRALYEDLFYLLQSRPRYLAELARLLGAKEIPMFVQTVVFDMYGDQYDTREERLLLSLFRRVLQAELAAATEKGSVLRANTAITHMLSAYARRGQGLSILKDILEEPLKQVTSRSDLNLEINPTKVYQQLIVDHETNTGTPSPLNKQVTDEEAARHPQVLKIVEQRAAELASLCEILLSRIMAGVDSIPYGMRWICKQLSDLSRQRFPDADRYQIGSLLGGYIYLRFFNPVIVTPDAINFISNKPSRIMRRNLVLIAKVLQNLSNGLLFGDKEVYMKRLNPFIQAKMDPLQDYFDRLIAVDDLDEALAVDKYLEHTNSRLNVIQVSYNQIFLLHQLLAKHLSTIVPDMNDPLRSLLSRLGPPPDEVKKEENRTVALKLTERRTQRMSTAADGHHHHHDGMDMYGNHTSSHTHQLLNPLYLQAKTLLLHVLRRLPSKSIQTSLVPFLEDEKRKALSSSNMSLADHCSNVISMLSTLSAMGMLNVPIPPSLLSPSASSSSSTSSSSSSLILTLAPPSSPTDPQYQYNAFLWSLATDSLSRARRLRDYMKKALLIESASRSIHTHHSYLESRLELYKIYLDNVRSGGGSGGGGTMSNSTSGNKSSGNKNNDHKKEVTQKVSHEKLEEMGVVTKTATEIPRAVLKKCVYQFTMIKPGVFRIEVVLKKGIELNLLKKPIDLELEYLLKLQEEQAGQAQLEFDYVSLNVNLLIHLLNTKFLS